MKKIFNQLPPFSFSPLKIYASPIDAETASDSNFKDVDVGTTLLPDRNQISQLRRGFSRRFLYKVSGQSAYVEDKPADHKQKTLRTLPLLDVYEFQTLTDYAEQNLIFTPENPLVCTPINLLYEDYLKFFYQTRYNGTESFEEFETILKKLKSKDKKTQRFRGLTTKYQFARALQHVAKEEFEAPLEKLRTRELVLQGVSLKNPNSIYLKNITY